MIDTHCHLNENDYDDVDKIIKNMENHEMITIGTNKEDNEQVLNLVQKYKNVYGTIGIHPEFANTYDEEDLKFIEKHINTERIVGIGECGLDYHWVQDNQNEQKSLFIKQIKLANKYNKTLVVHSRDAMEDTIAILKEHLKTKAVMHCFTGTTKEAQELMKMNIMFGIDGPITYKNNQLQKRVIENIPLEYILLETDSPYLTPEPLRGQKNEPRNVRFVAEKIAEIKKMKIEEILLITTQNACLQFDLKSSL